LKIYSKVDELGVDRVGIADMVGIATPPNQVYGIFLELTTISFSIFYFTSVNNVHDNCIGPTLHTFSVPNNTMRVLSE